MAICFLPEEPTAAQAQAAVAEVEGAVRDEVAAPQVARLAARLRELGENPDIQICCKF